MGLTRADVTGLTTLAAGCLEHADMVGSVIGAPPLGSSFQATAAAVGTAHADVAATGLTLMVRMQSTAHEIAAAGYEFARTEANSASALHTAEA
jgi:hypothetical protein